MHDALLKGAANGNAKHLQAARKASAEKAKAPTRSC